MRLEQVYHLHPSGWETDPSEERYKVTTLDYLSVQAYNNYALFFRLEDHAKTQAIEILKTGLEKTLSQVRHICGTIERDSSGGHSFVKKRESTVKFVVQWLEDKEYPSLDDIEKAHFTAVRLGDLNLWSVPPMTYGEKPEASPDVSPPVAAYKVNFVRGGLVFIMHHLHYSNDIMGWAGLTHQLAENCYALFNETSFPSWDVKNLDRERITKPEPPEENKVDGPPAPLRHPDQLPGQCLLFHLPKSKAAKLKALATPEDGTWISTYDAFCAFIWRHLTRVRAPVFQPDPNSPLFWSEAVDMRRRFHSPTVPPRTQGNVVYAAVNMTAGIPNPTISEIITDWPLSKLASYIRSLTNSVTQEALDATLTMVSMVRDKSALNFRIDSQPPMSIIMTDHRDASITAADFGFGRPITYRHLLDCVTNGVIVVYPPRATDGDGDEGCEFSIFYERDLARTLIEDVEFGEFFEFRGVDAEDAASLIKLEGTNN
ncbi:transferase [Aspergillus venezuelensis]